MRAHLRIVIATAIIALPLAAAGNPRKIDDCEKIEAADAYNRCLALFGPPARSVRLDSEPPGSTAALAEVASTTTPAPEKKRKQVLKRPSRHWTAKEAQSRHRQNRSPVVGQGAGGGKWVVFNVPSD